MMMTRSAPRTRLTLNADSLPALSLQMQRPGPDLAGPALGHVIYVHGSTFGADLSVFHALDGRSWADALCEAGFTVWGFDFAGYGASERYARNDLRAAGRMEEVLPQLQRVVAAVRERSGGAPVSLVAHSWGGSVAAAYAGDRPEDIAALALFAPVVARGTPAPQAEAETEAAAHAVAPSHYPLTLWAQYRRFVEDVPRGQPQVLAEAHFEAWGEAFLATDPQACDSLPAAVSTPSGPQYDVRALWSGHKLYDPARIVAPTLLVRGEWDTVCDRNDATRLLSALGGPVQFCTTIERATHLMHLEAQRELLYNAVNTFLLRSAR